MKKVINFIAGPGAGKSTTAAGLFHAMKKAGDNVELVAEYAKDMTWEGRQNILQDQLYMLSKQNRRLARLQDKVEYVITDSPLILCNIYAPKDYYPSFNQLVLDVFNSYSNITFYIERTKAYQAIGRNQTEAEAIALDNLIRSYFDTQAIPYQVMDYNLDPKDLREIIVNANSYKKTSEVCSLYHLNK